MEVLINPKLFLVVGLLLTVGNNGVESRNRINPQKPQQRSGHPIYEFASRLINQVGQERGQQSNILISPFSIRTALAIVYLGAKGKTADEIQKVLQLSTDKDELVQNLAKQINSASSATSSAFKIGNGIFLDKSIQLNEPFAKTLRDKLGSKIQSLDLNSNPSAASSIINSWVSEITNGKINSLVSPSSISSVTPFLLANALFYSGAWEKPFRVLPGKSKFQVDPRTQIDVQMMGIESTFGYSFIPELKSTGISLPFKDDRFEFIILKPEDGQSVDSVRPLLLSYPLEQLSSKLDESLRTVTLTLPKFTLKANYDTISTMRKMGIISLFDPRTCDVSGLTSSPNKDKIVLSRMIHQTLLDINELGATGAAGTALAAYPISSSSNLSIDKPFIFLLIDRLTGPVLIGQLVNPNQ